MSKPDTYVTRPPISKNPPKSVKQQPHSGSKDVRTARHTGAKHGEGS